MIQINPREVAAEAMVQILAEGAYNNTALRRLLRQNGAMSQQDRAFVTEIVNGTLRNIYYVDYVIDQFSNTKLSKIKPWLLAVLRTAVYQMLFMDVPDNAACNEAVKLARKKGFHGLTGFVNGVLRNFLRHRETMPWPETGVEGLAVRYSCPAHWITFWQKAYGEDFCHHLLESLTHQPFLYGRVNSLRGSVEDFIEKAAETGMKVTPVESVPGAVRLEHTGSVAEHPLYQQGWFHVQDLSSQVCVLQGALRPGMQVVDVCAAPGGKTFTAGEWMENQGTLFAYDLYKGKVGLIRSGAERLELTCVQAAVRNAETPAFSPEPADVVFCDAPCSGLGILRRKPEIRYKKPESLEELPGLQKRILQESAKLVKPGGRLVYSTCTLNPHENGEVAEDFLKNHPEFTPIPVRIPEGMSRCIEEPEHQLTMTPFSCGTDGFFVAAFQKRG